MASFLRQLSACRINLHNYVRPCASLRGMSNLMSIIHSRSRMDSSVETIQDIENYLIEAFKASKVSEAEESANFIIAHALGKKTLFSVPKHSVINQCQLKDIVDMGMQRLKHIPVQYILKEWDFCDITLAMKAPVFIPRPETEELVDHMASDPVVASSKHCIEIGPGSGAICLSLLKKFPALYCTAFEAGREAYDLTSTNAVSLGLSSRLNLTQMPLNQSTIYDVIHLMGQVEVDFIVSNPPYILTKDMQVLQKEVALYEDHQALDGGTDGLDVIRSILELAQKVLKPGGSLWLETDSSHPSQIEEMAYTYGLEYCKTIKDFGNFDRFCHLIR